MVENQHQKITGYRDLTQDEIDLMNEIKQMEENAANLLIDVGLTDCDQVALLSAQRKLTEGFMWLVRSVAQPNSPWPQLALHPEKKEAETESS